MKLKAGIANTEAGPRFCLYTEDGTVLPCQQELRVLSQADDITKIVVTFVVDGDNLDFAERADDRA